ncbi:transcription termination factor MTERF2, chloroplastic-like isoform X1 [Zingiber officinale]|uniref:transcription termination factor MTERF2, chloroplastic-like isoform X1 n=1 Tax=Zingiber officinale TaxID=94328 RepID=UPI001C4DD0A8|nr:transcription termination factor MTERF2, chloroplastic-like isoform X1 [Zingiber officinale]
MVACSLPSSMIAIPNRRSSADLFRSWNLVFVPCLRSNSSSRFVYSASASSRSIGRLRGAPVRFSFTEGDRGSSSAADSSAAEEAQEAVVEILRECGASEEESVYIASNSRGYLEMLIGNVQELDEHSLWGSWNREVAEEGVDLNSCSFRQKVYYMARRKGDKGILPFLESIGIKFSSALLIARYLSMEKLPELINKVNFVKGILFPSTNNEAFIGKNARRMMMYLSITADDDVQRTLSFFEKMEARQGGLNMLGNRDASFCYLIESFPKLLVLSVDNHFKPLVNFLELVGVPKEGISTILLTFPPILFYDIEKDLKPKLHGLAKAGAEETDIAKMILKYPWLLSSSIQKNYNRLLAYFNVKKIPKASFDIAIKSWPHVLGCSTSKMKSMVEQFAELGVSRTMMVPVITSSPQLLLMKPKEFLEVVSFMEEFGFDSTTIGRILRRCPEIFASSIENTLRKKVQFLMDFGISKDRLRRVIRKYPEMLLLDTDNTLLPRLRFLMKVGLSKKEVCSMICRFSPILGYSIEVVLEPKLEFLLRTMKKPLKEIVEYPRYFSYSLHKKIRPRFSVLKSRNLDYSLEDMLSKNDEDFVRVYMGVEVPLVVPSVTSKDAA